MSKKLQISNYARALKRLRILVIMSIFAALFANQSARAQDPITIRVWGYGLDDARAQARLATFEAAQPEIKIEAVGGNVDVQQLLTAVASGDPPEVVNLDRTQIGSWAARGVSIHLMI